MDDLICSLCGKPVTDEDEAAGNFYDDEFLGMVHGDCYDEALEPPEPIRKDLEMFRW